MRSSRQKNKKKAQTIDATGITNNTLTSQAGWVLFVRYLSGVEFYFI